MNHLTLSAKELAEIQDHHLHSIDKHFRMGSGISSDLISVINGVARLRITIHPGWKRPPKETSQQFVNDWSRFNPVLKNVISWEVLINMDLKIAGFMIRSSEVKSPHTERLIKQMNRKSDPKLEYMYKTYIKEITQPTIKLIDRSGDFELEYIYSPLIIEGGFFHINDRRNYILYNTQEGGNFFLKPQLGDDYFVFKVSDYDEIQDFRLLSGSKQPMLYAYHGAKFYLINASIESLGLLMWRKFMEFPKRGVEITSKA